MEPQQDPTSGARLHPARRHRICVFNLNDTRRDPRVQRISQAMASRGHEVRVFEMQSGDAAAEEMVVGLPVQRVAVPGDYSQAAIAEIERLSPAAGEILHRCDPTVMGAPGVGRFGLRVHLLRQKIAQLRARVSGRAAPAGFDPDLEVAAIRSILLLNLEIYRQAKQYAPTLVYCNDLDTLLAGFMMKAELGVELIYDAHEIYPEQFADHMRSEIWHGFYTGLEKALVPHADGRLTVCESLGAYFAEHYAAPGFVTIRNAPSLRHLPDASILERRRDRRKLLYHGAYYPYRGLDEIIDAAAMIENADIVFRGVGGYGAELEKRAASRGVADRVTFMPPVPVDQLVGTASDGDIGLNPFINVCRNTEFALPNKFFEYMMAGLAVASSDLVEMRRLTRQLDVGILFGSLEPAAIAASLNAFLARPDEIDACRARAYHAAKTELNWECERERFLSFLARFE